jgi:hypothetical protein
VALSWLPPPAYSGSVLKILIIVLLVAVTIYALARLADRRRGGSAPRPRPEPPRPVAPDDDPAFLRDLDRRHKKPQKDEPDPS